MLDPVVEVFGFGRLGDNLQIVNAPANGDAKLMGVYDASEETPRLLPSLGFGQKILIAGEQRPVQRRSPIQKFVVRKTGCAIRL